MLTISLDGKPAKVRNWYKGHVYCWCRFKILRDILWEQIINPSNPSEKKRAEQRMRHLQGKIHQRMEGAELLGINEEEVKSFNLAIIENMKRGKSPQEIIQILLKNGQK